MESMNNSEYEKQNYVKASFDAGYIAPTPHLYFHNMSAVNYRMAEYMNPFLAALVDPPRGPSESWIWGAPMGCLAHC